MPRHSLLSMNDLVHEDQDKKKQKFLQDTEDFPCLFNLGNCKFDIGKRKYRGNILCEIDVPKNKWKSLLEDLNNEDEVSECDEVVWKENLLTYVYVELGEYEEAFKLNKQIQSEYGRKNLVALINAVFLFFKVDNFKEAFEKLDDLKKLKSQQTFTNLKIDAICELGYAFRKLAGPKNLQLSITFLEFVLLFCPHDEQIQLMLGIVYRRCSHFHIYSADPENINRHDCALKAANILNKLGTTSTNKSYKAAALIELAYLKYVDDVCDERNYRNKCSILSQEEWFQIVEEKTWKQLCEEALEVCDDGPSEKVLKIAGQLYRYYGADDEFLKKSEQLLLNAIKKRPSNRAHHHLGLTYRKLAVHHEWEHNVDQKLLVEGCSKKPNWQYKSNGISNHTLGRKRQNRGNYHNRFAGRQEHTIPRGNFHNNARGGYISSGRDRNHRGFINRSEQIKHEVLENDTEDASGCRFEVLPEPSINNSPQKPHEQLKRIIKVPDQFKSFSKDNPYTDKAIHHLKQAVELSCYQNRSAVYDYACILVQAEDYEKSKEICYRLINECTSSKTTIDPLRLVSAYNLLGICSKKEDETEEIEVNKKRLAAESEKYLTQAVRLASCLAASVPELEMCATDLWNAFITLQTKFKFEGQKDSRDKLFMLCEFISDYRCLEAIDDILSQDRKELEKMKVIEECLNRYLNLKSFDSALLFRDLILLLPGMKAKLAYSQVYKQLMLEVAEGKLDETYRQTEVYHPDLGWKQLFDNEFFATLNSKKYDVVIVGDIDEDYELKSGLMYDISEYLKLVLLEQFGLKVVCAHEKGFPGCNYLEEQPQIISNSRVSIFVLTEPYIDSESLASKLAGLRVSESQTSPPESSAVNKVSKECCPPEGAVAGNQPKNENSVSRMYERIINASLSNCLNNVGSTRMMLVVPHSLKLEDLPQAVRGLPTVVLSQNEIETLTATASDRPNEQCLSLMKKIFRAVLGNWQECIHYLSQVTISDRTSESKTVWYLKDFEQSAFHTTVNINTKQSAANGLQQTLNQVPQSYKPHSQLLSLRY